MNYKPLFECNKDIISKTRLCVNAIYRQNFDRGIRIFCELIQQIQRTMEIIITNAQAMQKDGLQIDTKNMMQMLQGLLSAQEEKDYILLADLLELTIVPFCIELQQNLQTIAKQKKDGISMLYPSNWEQNMNCLQEVNPVLAAKMRTAYERLQPMNDAVYAFQSAEGVKYYLEETQTGDLTLRVQRNKRNYYMHSNNDSMAQAELFAETYLDTSSYEYDILGFGRYFHIEAIARNSLYAKNVHVYEPDINVLIVNLIAGNYEVQMKSWLHIYFDPNMQQLSETIVNNPKGFMIHYPSLFNIENAKIRNSFEKFFITNSAARNHKSMLDINYQINMELLQTQREQYRLGVADDILDAMKGKDVFIIAAGPSLDKNVEQLRERKAHTFILATGTVFYKLMQMGIRPDAVIITDANDRVIWQIREHEEETIPMLLLSTANRNFIKRYHGPKYLIFQEGFEPAEGEAKRNGYRLFQTGGSVSTTALDVAISAKANRIIFLGLDLAFTDNLAHATGTSNRIATDIEELTSIKGFYGDTVMADSKFIIYREWIERRIKENIEGMEIINATEGGCYIEGMQHKELRQILGESNRKTKGL